MTDRDATEVVCGLKLTHDGGVALIEATADSTRLVAATELEKCGNHKRHMALDDTRLVDQLFGQLGHSVDEVSRFVVDGWGPPGPQPGLSIVHEAGRELIRTAPYRQSDDDNPVLHCYLPDSKLPLGGKRHVYESYRHVECHVASAYLTSPAAVERQPALVLVWDGGLFPELYLVDPTGARVDYLGYLFGLQGCVYEEFSSHVPPFVPDPEWTKQRSFVFRMTSPGKVMAYAGLGTVCEPLVAELRRVIRGLDGRLDGPALLYGEVEPTIRRLGVDGPSVLASFQEALARLLIDSLAAFVKRLATPLNVLCFAGGSALNIKWNSAIRTSGLFQTLWVPPFPNDSGAAIGTACASVMRRGGFQPLEWSVYCGPALSSSRSASGWHGETCSVEQLGVLLATADTPVTVLSGEAELGPRALGHRSILASPCRAEMKDVLNRIKGRESYRPVAPMCLEEHSAEIFDPGGADPFMLFDHYIRPDWVHRIPAVMHVDGTARLQTVDDRDSPLAAAVVRAFAARSGIPVLCNTSANYAGRGFFPDVASAMEWGRTPYIWSDDTLYSSRH